MNKRDSNVNISNSENKRNGIGEGGGGRGQRRMKWKGAATSAPIAIDSVYELMKAAAKEESVLHENKKEDNVVK